MYFRVNYDPFWFDVLWIYWPWCPFVHHLSVITSLVKLFSFLQNLGKAQSSPVFACCSWRTCFSWYNGSTLWRMWCRDEQMEPEHRLEPPVTRHRSPEQDRITTDRSVLGYRKMMISVPVLNRFGSWVHRYVLDRYRTGSWRAYFMQLKLLSLFMLISYIRTWYKYQIQASGLTFFVDA